VVALVRQAAGETGASAPNVRPLPIASIATIRRPCSFVSYVNGKESRNAS